MKLLTRHAASGDGATSNDTTSSLNRMLKQPKLLPGGDHPSGRVRSDRFNTCRASPAILITKGVPGKKAHSYSWTYPWSAICVKWNASQRRRGDALDTMFGDESNRGSLDSNTSKRAVSTRVEIDSTCRRRMWPLTVLDVVDVELMVSIERARRRMSTKFYSKFKCSRQ